MWQTVPDAGVHLKHHLESRLVLDRLAELQRASIPAALATVVRVRGSAYRHEGAKLLVAAEGSTTGNVSGGCLELDVPCAICTVIDSPVAALEDVDTPEDWARLG